MSLHSGDALTRREANAVMASAPTTLVVLAGAASVGKTTLLSVLYEQYLRGGFAEYLFAGSLTLKGFEDRCHLSRLASWQATPDTERTQRGTGSMMLHLRLANRLMEPIDVLFTDIAGEEFDAVRDFPTEASVADIVRRADHFAVALDSTELVNPYLRHAARANTRQLMRSGAEHGLLSRATGIQVVATKWDVIDVDERDSVREFLDQIRTDVVEVMPSVSADVSLHITASRRATDGSIKEGHGFEALLKEWLRVGSEKDINRDLYLSGSDLRPFDSFKANK